METQQHIFAGSVFEISGDFSLREHMIENYPAMVKVCAICRGFLLERCIECESKLEVLDIKDIETLLAKRIDLKEFKNDTSLRVLPRDILGFIGDRISIQGYVKVACSISKGSCNHIYHTHCIERWLKKRQNCPLDNESWFTREMDSHCYCEIVKKL